MNRIMISDSLYANWPGTASWRWTRSEREGFLKVSVELDPSRGLNIVYSVSVKEGSACTDAVREAAEDAYSRLIFPGN